MAEIPVERKEGSSFPWWLIPLILLLLLLPLLYFCNKSNVADNSNVNRTAVTTNANNSVGNMRNGSGTVSAANSGAMGNVATGANSGNMAIVVNNGDATNAGAARNGAVVKDINEFGNATDKSTLVGRGFFAESGGVRVNRVLSDKVFTVKSGSGELFVMLDDNLDSSGGKEKQIKMRPGQNVNLGGEFRNIPTGEVAQETKGGGLNAKEYAQMKGQNVYLHATSVSDVK